MQNDPELNGKYLGIISSDFVKVADTLREASYQLRKRAISACPVVAISRTASLPLGALLLARGQGSQPLVWSYYLTFLEELLQRGIVAAEAQAAFRATYKDADEYCCLLVVEPDFTNFVFIPYPED